MFLDILELRVENNKKEFSKNCFDIVVPNLWKNGLNCPWNYLEKNNLENADFNGVYFGHYAICDAIYTCL